MEPIPHQWQQLSVDRRGSGATITVSILIIIPYYLHIMVQLKPMELRPPKETWWIYEFRIPYNFSKI